MFVLVTGASRRESCAVDRWEDGEVLQSESGSKRGLRGVGSSSRQREGRRTGASGRGLPGDPLPAVFQRARKRPWS